MPSTEVVAALVEKAANVKTSRRRLVTPEGLQLLDAVDWISLLADSSPRPEQRLPKDHCGMVSNPKTSFALRPVVARR